eukprot:TRINITY_DN123364_c0_g1_i2.p1 TRINITY_DN123364_c0_g1~~TRINITY_DN123364_c0_g1_i2.p1  ORF type:complete len:255 (+),score=40.05 TRINITY_DN123364_c0_g1_i2:65-766(+)
MSLLQLSFPEWFSGVKGEGSLSRSTSASSLASSCSTDSDDSVDEYSHSPLTAAFCALPLLSGPSQKPRKRSIEMPATARPSFPAAREPIKESRPSPTDVAKDIQADSYKALVAKQEANLAKIKAELEEHGQKVGHWAWWVFPTDQEGKCDPARTKVTTANAVPLCQNPSTARLWQEVLEKICELVEKSGTRVLPKRDHGRVFWFVSFWRKVEDAPQWMKDVCGRLAGHAWPPC